MLVDKKHLETNNIVGIIMNLNYLIFYLILQT